MTDNLTREEVKELEKVAKAHGKLSVVFQYVRVCRQLLAAMYEVERLKKQIEEGQ